MRWFLTNAIYYGLIWLGIKGLVISFTFLVGFLNKGVYDEGTNHARSLGIETVWSQGAMILWACIFWLIAMLDFTLVYKYFEITWR